MHSGCVVFHDGTIFKESVFQPFAEGCKRFFLLFSRRPGLDNINIERHWGHERRFSLSLKGLAIGHSGSSAHFFVATHGDTLLYLDPHFTQPAMVCGAGGSAFI